MAESTVKVTFIGDARDLKRAMGDIDDSAERAHGSFGKLAAVAGGVFAGGAVVAGIKSVVGAASDLNETISKSQVLFGESAGALQQWADGAAKNFGQSKQQALDAASTFAVFGKSAGLSGQSLVDFSTKFTGLASDMASFSNTSPQEAIEAIGAALRGEAEPIRKFGVLLDDATLRTEALKLGIISSTKDALTPQQKVLAAQAAIFAQTGAAQGDFARTSDGLANRTRILSAQFADMRTEIGQKLLPVAVKLAGFMLDDVVPALERFGGAVSRAVAQFREAFTSFMKFGEWEASGPFEKLGVSVAKTFKWISDEVRSVAAIFDEFGFNVHAVGLVLGNFTGDLLSAFGVSGDTAAKWSERIREGFYDVVAVAQAVFGWLRDNIPPIIEGIANVINTVIGAVAAWWDKHWEDIRAVTEFVINIIRTVIETTLAAIQAFWRTFGDEVVRVVVTAFNLIRGTIEAVLDVIRGLMDIVMGVIRGDWGRAWDGVKQVVSAVWDEIQHLIGAALNLISAAISAAMTVMAGVFDAGWDRIKKIFSDAPGYILAALGALPGLLFDFGTKAISFWWNGLIQMWGGVLDWFAGLPDRILGAVGDLAWILYDIGRAVLTGFWEGLKSVWGDVSDWLGGIAGKIKGIKGPIDKDRVMLKDEGRAIMAGLHAGMVEGWGPVEKFLASRSARISGTIDAGPMRFGGGTGGGAAVVNLTVNNPTLSNPVTIDSLAFSISKQAAVAFAGAA